VLPLSALCPYTTLFRSPFAGRSGNVVTAIFGVDELEVALGKYHAAPRGRAPCPGNPLAGGRPGHEEGPAVHRLDTVESHKRDDRSEEHTSELQSRVDLV